MEYEGVTGSRKIITTVGTWGGTGGSNWDDGSYTGVRSITLAYGQCIDSIRVEYDKNGKPVLAEKHGGTGGSLTTIRLQFPEEFLTTVSGYYCPFYAMGPVVIRSLIFKSNRRSFGPFGVQEGTPFSFPMDDGGLIVGFKGRSGYWLDAVGFHLSRVHESKLFERLQLNMEYEGVTGSRKTITVGTWGGTGGSNWDDGSYTGVRSITLAYGQCIDSIRVEYDKNGKPVLAEKHGGTGGGSPTTIRLQFPEEFLTTVSGHYCPFWNRGPVVIRSLTFKSNRRSFGPFGVQEGTPFSFPMDDGGLIVGFKGRSGLYLDAIGFHLSRVHESKLFERLQLNMEYGGVTGSRKTITVGTWGGTGGSNWDDGSYTGVRSITLAYGRCIDFIRVEYDKNGKPVLAEKHGGTGGGSPTTIQLQFPEEFLTTVSGHYCPFWNRGPVVIRSLTFKSNRRSFGPFGVQEGTPFSFPLDGGLIVGFKGRSGSYLDAIGFHLSRVYVSNLREIAIEDATAL